MRRRPTAAPSLALASVLSLALIAGCAPGVAPAEPPTLAPTAARPTPAGPTPSLPVARAVAPPSAVEPGAQQTALAQSFVLHSSAFNDGAALPADFYCDGAGGSPPLDWSGAPVLTRAYSLVVQDTDGRNGQAVTEWLLYNVPSNITELQPATPPRPLLTNGAQQGLNSERKVGYVAPCPDKGAAAHHVTFMLYAQDAYVTLETAAPVEAVTDALNGHTLGQTHLTALVQR